MTLRLFLAFGLILTKVLANQPYHASVRFENIPADEELVTFAIDGSGDVFTVGYVTNGFGQQQIRADKFDPSGNSLGTFEFATVSGLYSDSIGGADVDPNGNLVIAGSLNTNTPGLITIGDTLPVFVVKIDSQLKAILSSTTLGATSPQHVSVFTMAGGLTIDRSGNIYVTGQTSNPNFPVTTGAFQTQLTAEMNGMFPTYAFVTKITPDGKTIVFSTYFGSASVPCDPASYQCLLYAETNGSAIAVDAAGDVVIAGYTNASGLPFPAGALSSSCGVCGEDASGRISYAGFVAKFSADGTKLLAGTYVPVSATGPYCNDVGIGGLALDGAGNIVVSGLTSSVLPVTPGAVQTAFPDTESLDGGFVLKLDPSAGHLVFGTYFGGTGVMALFSYGAVGGVAVDTQGTIWLTGVSAHGAVACATVHAVAWRNLPGWLVPGRIDTLSTIHGASRLRRIGDCFNQFGNRRARPFRSFAYGGGGCGSVSGRDHEFRWVRTIHFDRAL